MRNSNQSLKRRQFGIFFQTFYKFYNFLIKKAYSSIFRWHIYCVTNNYVYFGCAPFTDLSIENQENLTASLFQDTNHVARMQIDDFLLQSRQYSKLQGLSLVYVRCSFIREFVYRRGRIFVFASVFGRDENSEIVAIC